MARPWVNVRRNLCIPIIRPKRLFVDPSAETVADNVVRLTSDSENWLCVVTSIRRPAEKCEKFGDGEWVFDLFGVVGGGAVVEGVFEVARTVIISSAM